jgi:hypothetical protein
MYGSYFSREPPSPGLDETTPKNPRATWKCRSLHLYLSSWDFLQVGHKTYIHLSKFYLHKWHLFLIRMEWEELPFFWWLHCTISPSMWNAMSFKTLLLCRTTNAGTQIQRWAVTGTSIRGQPGCKARCHGRVQTFQFPATAIGWWAIIIQIFVPSLTP